MTMLKKITVAGGLFAVSSLVAATAAFAHPGDSNEASHTYANAEVCTNGAPALSQTTDTAYPTDGYAADCGVAQGIDSTKLSATAHVLATCSINDVTNETASVNPTNHPGQTYGDAVDPAALGFAAGDAGVTSFDFPTQVSISGGGVNSDSLRVNVNCNSDWQLDATVDGDFAKIGDATQTKAATTFGVTDKTGALLGFTGVGNTQTLGTHNSGEIDSGDFHFRSGVANGIEAGDYTGSFTLTVTAVQNA